MNHEYREFTYASRDGLALFCREYRPSAPRANVLCLPGLTRNSQDFAALARHLAGHYRVLTPDLRGRGRSQWDPRPANYHPATYFHDVITLLDQQVRGAVIIIGTSLGGILGMSLAAMVPNRVVGLVLNDIGPEIAPQGLARIGGYVGRGAALDSWAEAVAQVKANHAQAYPGLSDAAWLEYAQASYRQRDDGRIVADYDPAIGTTLRAAPPTTFDLWPLWSAIRQPVLAIRGAHSDILSAATFERMLRDKPTLTRIEVAGRGHVPQLNEPGVRDGIDAFLLRISK